MEEKCHPLVQRLWESCEIKLSPKFRVIRLHVQSELRISIFHVLFNANASFIFA